jgi:hypothetical protein
MFSTRSMPTSLHIPKELAGGPTWSPGFFEQLTALKPEEAQAVDAMLEGIREARTRKSAPKAAGVVLVTADVRHMVRVPGLTVEDWSK